MENGNQILNQQIGREQNTRLKNLIIKKLLEQNFHALSFVSKRSFICCGSLVNLVVAAVFIYCSNL